MAVPPLSKLLVPQAEAAEKITAQINSGRKIVFSFGPPPGFGFGSDFDRAAALRAKKNGGGEVGKIHNRFTEGFDY
jgi:hypothetical protein